MKWKLVKLSRGFRMYTYLLPDLKGEITITVVSGEYRIKSPSIKHIIRYDNWSLAKRYALFQVRVYDERYPTV